MRIGVCILVLLTVGCAPAAEDPGCADRRDNHFRLDPFASTADAPPDDRSIRGHITAWGPEVEIVAKDGIYGFGLVLIETELSAPGQGPFDISARGFHPPLGDLSAPALALSDPVDGAPVWMAGNVELIEPMSGWTIESPRDETTCLTWSGEAGRQRNKPVYFTHESGEEAVLFQGEEIEIAGMLAAVIGAQSNNRAHPWAPCEDEECPWEKLSWSLADVALAGAGSD